jgi:cytochrome c-type biogenesis protein CcmH/NrfG
LQKLGEKDLLHGRLKEALQHYDDALDIDDDNVTSLAGKATALLEMAEVDMAKQTISKLLSLDASNIQVLFKFTR